MHLQDEVSAKVRFYQIHINLKQLLLPTKKIFGVAPHIYSGHPGNPIKNETNSKNHMFVVPQVTLM